ncbi:MAG: DUF4010 domain-containing protein [Candidatus Dojkabacteria bacterium]|nr:DUF4010 domain-containing protein [Candidatus Dojkabacteria bacterium]
MLLSFFLSQKRGLGSLIEKIQHKELINIIKFGLVAVVVLPLLPNKDILVSDAIHLLNIDPSTLDISKDVLNFSILNPFKMWFIVVLVSGINLINYLISKFISSNKGIPLTAFIGGMISSTSTSIALATKSKKEDIKNVRVLAGSALISNASSFLSNSLILMVSSLIFFRGLLPALIAMFLVGSIVGTIFIFISKKQSNGNLDVKYEPFSIIPALKFVLIIILLKLVVQTTQLLDLGELSLIATAVSGLTGLDAASIALADLVEKGDISLKLAVITYLSTNLVNFIAKMIYSKIGGRIEFAKIFTLGLIITAVGSLAVFIF